MKSYYFLLFLLIITSFTLTSQNWISDFELAKEIAKEKDHKIILVFQGSDWCAPCIKMDKEIWSTKEFKEYAKEHYVMLQADFPKKKKNALTTIQQQQNNYLAEKYNKNGYFPFVLILNNTGDVLGEFGYKKRPPIECITIINSFSD